MSCAANQRAQRPVSRSGVAYGSEPLCDRHFLSIESFGCRYVSGGRVVWSSWPPRHVNFPVCRKYVHLQIDLDPFPVLK